MENGWDLFNNHNTNNNINSSSSSFARGQQDNNNCTSNHPRAIWESRTPPRILDWSTDLNSFNQDTTNPAGPGNVNASTNPQEDEGLIHALMFNNGHHTSSSATSASSPFSTFLYTRGGGGGSHSHCYPDPHLMCLKLGKRQYFGDAATPLGDRQEAAAPGFSITKKGKPYHDAAGGLLVRPSTTSASTVGVTVAATPAVVPRCQVDGCHVALANAKDYHRRHKVCEMHSKAPKVVVLGLEQRFCQQCSRSSQLPLFSPS